MKKKKLFMTIAAMMVIAVSSCNKQRTTSTEAEDSPKEAAVAVSDTQTVSSIDELGAPDFTLKDPNGKDTSLSSLVGKPLVLDFWGSWCIWCIRGFPKMKEYYQKYAGKFEILGIDCNDSDEAWRKAVKENDLPWLQVYCPDGSSVFDDYDIQGFPTKIILDARGRVMKTFLGEDPAFYQYLDEILNAEH